MRKSAGYWTFENCQKEALKYNCKINFIRNSKGAYKASIINNWYNIITSHMIRPKNKIILKRIDDVYQVNHFQFFDITKPEIAYILGLIWSDGHISKNGYNIEIYCKYEENINSDYNTIKNIILKTGKWNIYIRHRYDKRTNNTYHSATFQTTNRYLWNFLFKMDYDKKSYVSPTKILNHIPTKYQPDFFRGYSDGDGCFYIKNNTVQYAISSTISQNWISCINLFNKININKFNIQKQDTKKRKYSAIRIANKLDIIKLGEYLYLNSEGLRFERKYQTYLKIKEIDIQKMSPNWTNEEIDFLRKNYKRGNLKYCMESLNRTKYSIGGKCSELQIRINKKKD
jgi:hypothetical protein